MKHIIIYSETDLANDPRVYRQIEALSKNYKITAIGCGYPTGIDCTYVDITSYIFKKPTGKNRIIKLKNIISTNGIFKALLFFILYISKKITGKPIFYYLLDVLLGRRKITKLIKNIDSDLIIANDFTGLLTIIPLLKSRSILYDAHEYTPGQYISTTLFKNTIRYYNYILDRYLRKVTSMTTVSEGIALEYEKVFKIKKPNLIINAPFYVNISPKYNETGKIKLIHHGLATKLRNIEHMINMMKFLDEKYTLDFYLVKRDEKYYNLLIDSALEDNRIRFNNPILMPDIPEMLNNYDVGLSFFSPVTFNLKRVLPNKFFEYIQGRICIATGPSPDLVSYIKKYNLGVIARDFTPEAMAEVLKKLTIDDINRFKENSNKYAYELSAEPQMEKLKKIVANLLK